MYNSVILNNKYKCILNLYYFVISINIPDNFFSDTSSVCNFLYDESTAFLKGLSIIIFYALIHMNNDTISLSGFKADEIWRISRVAPITDTHTVATPMVFYNVLQSHTNV